jgi:hypothetical protein
LAKAKIIFAKSGGSHIEKLRGFESEIRKRMKGNIQILENKKLRIEEKK